MTIPERDREPVKVRLRRAWKETNHESALEQLTAWRSSLTTRTRGGGLAQRGDGGDADRTRLGVTGKLKLTLQSTNRASR